MVINTLLLYITVCTLVFPDSIHQCLLYPHSWVRLVSSRLLGILFASANIEDIAQTLTGHDGAGRNKVWLAFFVNGGLAKVGFLQNIYYKNVLPVLYRSEKSSTI